MDLSIAFDCLPHNLLIAKLEAYGIKSHLTGCKQCVKNADTLSLFTEIISVVQGSILVLILFMYLSMIYFYFSLDNLHNFADNDRIAAISSTTMCLIQNQTVSRGVDNF